MIITSFFYVRPRFVQADTKKDGNITLVTEERIEGWATSPGEGDGKGNTISYFLVHIQVKGQDSTEVRYRADAIEVPADRNGEKKYTFSLDMAGKWPAAGKSAAYEIVVDAYRTLGNGQEELYFTFPSTPYEYIKDSTTNNAALDFTFTASQDEYAKPPNGDAQGRLDVTLIPKGKIDSLVRPPIDVVFVFDVSGSMSFMKLQSAKYALQSAVDYFKTNANPNDRFALIPFSDTVKNVVPFSAKQDVKAQLDLIASTANSLTAGGGTNYSAALQTAQSFFNDPSRKKYIIFLTDGMPTVLRTKEKVTFNFLGITWTETADVEYTLFADGRTAMRTAYSQYGIRQSWYVNYQDTETKIRTDAINVAKNLGMNNITLYSIGFGDNQDVDMNYLEKLSATTGGQAKQGTPQNLTEIFQQFSKLATDPVLSGTIKIPLTSFGGNVQIVETDQVWLDDKKENAYITFSIPYKVGQPTPPPVTISIPVLFKAKGTYTFNAELTYRNVYGELQPPMTKSVTVVVKDEVPPSFDGTVTLQGITRDVGDLVKFGNADGDTNQFKATYSLMATGYVGNASGNISNIKLIQPLPDGITAIPSQNVTVYTKNGVQYAEIAFPNTVIDYKKLNNNQITAELTLQANWAMEGVQLPPATVSFQDSKYGAQTASLTPPSQRIAMKVRLGEFPDMYYEGDSRGLITKWQELDSATNLLGTTKHPNNYGLLMLPVKALQYKDDDDSVLLVTYNNDQTVSLSLKPHVAIVTASGQSVASGATVTEQPTAKMTDVVAGEGVTYEYKVENPKQDNSWRPLDSPYEIPITWDGVSTISIRSKGGLTKGDGITTVSLTYIKLIRQLTLGDYKQAMEIGETQTIPVTILPDDATNKTLQWTSSNPDVATVEDGTVTAVHPGTAEITVKATDGSNVAAKAIITVIDPFVPLKAIHFQQPVLYMTVGQELDVQSQLTFDPENATDKRLYSVQSTAPEYVEARQQQGKWYIVAKDVGYSTITAIANAKTKDGQEIKDSIIVVVQEKSSSGGDGESGKNRW
ncbi:VWA domain-containing protein [Saccharococcus thermophilus]|nr:VWA domain-containing protein [Saccharococcus thermophilus]